MFFSLFTSWPSPWGRGYSKRSPLFLLSPPRDYCKIFSCLLAKAQSLLRAQVGAAANENLDATASRAGEGLGSQGGQCQALAPAGFLLAPSELVSASPQHLGRGSRWLGEAQPHTQPPAQPHVSGGIRLQGTKGMPRPGCPPDHRPPGPAGKGQAPGPPVVVVFSLCALHGLGCHPAQPESVSTCRNTQAAPGITSQWDCSGWLCSWARRSRPEPPCASFSCPYRF